ncbi:hypothetical protein LT493_28940 [Streptomyces tricolor]|nr:hypothetical protein [Streptomyces tricolor]
MALMLASQVSPLYVDRYVLYALSGAPLLVAAGAERVAGGGGPPAEEAVSAAVPLGHPHRRPGPVALPPSPVPPAPEGPGPRAAAGRSGRRLPGWPGGTWGPGIPCCSCRCRCGTWR